jgi:hypothetical protein
MMGLTTLFNQQVAQQPAASGHAGPIAIFNWGGVPNSKPKHEEKTVNDLIEFTQPFAVISRNDIRVKTTLALVKRDFTSFRRNVSVVKREIQSFITQISVIGELEQKLQALDAMMQSLAHEKRQIAKEKQEQRWRFEQATTNREYWAKAGYCYCSRFTGVHNIKDCEAVET